VNFNFSWEDDHHVVHEKKITTSFMGVSPEFELALYTLCYLVGEQDNYVTIDDYDLNIKVYKMDNGSIGSSFPQLIATHHDHHGTNIRN